MYDGISPFNKPSGLWFILTQQCMGENENIQSNHLSIFKVEKLIDAFEVHFSWLHCYTLSKTLIACWAMQLRFFKSENIVKQKIKQA